MLARGDIDLVASVAQRAARLSPPPPPSDVETRRWVQRAVTVAAARVQARRTRQRRTLGLSLLGAAAACALIGVANRAVAPAPEESIARVSLATGDRLTMQRSARFEVVSRARERRAVVLHDGAMLFDVAKLGHGQRFEVTTPDADIRVLGTVFTVETHRGHTVVRVYEGSVSVEHAGRAYTLTRGGRFVSDVSMRDQETPSALAAEAAIAVERREDERAGTDAAAAAAQGVSPAAGASVAVVPAASETSAASAAVSPQAPAAIGEDDLRATAAALEAAIPHLDGVSAQDAAYRAALLYADELDEPERALYVLQASGVRGPARFRNPRNLDLYVRLLGTLQRDWEARAIARRYLRDYPSAPVSDALRRAAESTAPSLPDTP